MEKEPLLQSEHSIDAHYLESSGGSVKSVNERSAPRRGVLTKLTVVCIIGTELCERLTFYSVVGNLVILATNVLGYTSAEAILINLLFVGKCIYTCFSFPPLNFLDLPCFLCWQIWNL